MKREEVLHIYQSGEKLDWVSNTDAPNKTIATVNVSKIMIENLQYMVRENVQSLLKHISENQHIYK